MAELAHRVQILLTEEQHRSLRELAEARQKPLSVFLREGLVELVLAEARRATKRQAYADIVAMTLPVEEWPQMERQIERAHGAATRRKR